MGIVSGVRVVEKLMSGDINTAQLDSWLATGDNSASLRFAANSNVLVRSLLDSSVACGVVVNSTAAVTALSESDFFMSMLDSHYNAPLFAGSNTATEAVIASPKAFASFIESDALFGLSLARSAFRTSLFNLDSALLSLKGSVKAAATMRAYSGYSVLTSGSGYHGSGQTFSTAVGAASYIVVGASIDGNSPGYLETLATRRSGSTVPNTFTPTTAGTMTALTNTLMLPIVSPFTSTSSTNPATYATYIGVIRCDI